MNTPDLSLLQQEVIRLNKIISVLLEQNDMLKLNYSRLEKQMITNEKLHSHTEQQMTTNERLRSHLQQQDETNTRLHSHVQQQGGTSERLHSNTELQDETNEKFYSNTELPTGMSESIYSNTQLHLPVSKEYYPNTQLHLPVSKEFYPVKEQDMPVSREFYSQALQQGAVTLPLYTDPGKSFPSGEPLYQLPPTIEASQQNIGLLCGKLSTTVLKRSRDTAQRGAAKLLIHFYNKGTGRYDALRKLTGYSEGGLGKLMMLVRTKGLIQRKAFQQFVPSPAALKLMQEAGLK